MKVARHPFRRALTVVGALAAGTLSLTAVPAATAPPAAAASGAALAVPPQTPVSSNGARIAVPNVASTSSYSRGHAGTGQVLSPGSRVPSGAVPDTVRTHSIYGPDNRVRITPTTTFPARAVVQITRNGAAHCTGWLISADTVATAGHCLHTGGSGGSWYTGLAVWPGRDGSYAPYGSCTTRYSSSVSGWVRNSDETYDYGTIKLNCRVGNTTGWFGFWSQSAGLAGQVAIVQGYPGDKTFGQQWRGDDVTRWVAVSQDRLVFYQNDTYGGMSGSPVFQNRTSCGWCAMAIHTQGFHGSSPHNRYNHGTRITSSVYNNLVAWKTAA
jgi:glutamyl endopeptidase